jgi:hypothetical protein
MFIAKTMKFCRKQCHAVYLISEHATAVMYAVCEFTDLHIMLIFASIVLLLGIILIVTDKVLTLAGYVLE